MRELSLRRRERYIYTYRERVRETDEPEEEARKRERDGIYDGDKKMPLPACFLLACRLFIDAQKIKMMIFSRG